MAQRPQNPMIYGSAATDLGLGSQLADDTARLEEERRKKIGRMGQPGAQGQYGDPSSPLGMSAAAILAPR